MQGKFTDCLMGFTLLPENDGQPFHTTSGDSGGTTSYGIVRDNWSRWIKRPATDADMMAITPATAAPLYEAWFWKTVEGDALPAGVDVMVFDHGVLAGESTSARQLQEVVRTQADGWIGPATISCVMARDPAALIGMLAYRQEAYYRSLSSFSRFGNGWLARIDRRVAAALAMSRVPSSPIPTS